METSENVEPVVVGGMGDVTAFLSALQDVLTGFQDQDPQLYVDHYLRSIRSLVSKVMGAESFTGFKQGRYQLDGLVRKRPRDNH